MGFYMAMAYNNSRLNVEWLLQLLDKLYDLRRKRDEHRKAHHHAA